MLPPSAVFNSSAVFVFAAPLHKGAGPPREGRARWLAGGAPARRHLLLLVLQHLLLFLTFPHAAGYGFSQRWPFHARCQSRHCLPRRFPRRGPRCAGWLSAPPEPVGWVLSLTLCLRGGAFNYARQGKQIGREGQPLLGSQKVYEDNDDGDPRAVKIALCFREADMPFDRAASCLWLLSQPKMLPQTPRSPPTPDWAVQPETPGANTGLHVPGPGAPSATGGGLAARAPSAPSRHLPSTFRQTRARQGLLELPETASSLLEASSNSGAILDPGAAALPESRGPRGSTGPLPLPPAGAPLRGWGLWARPPCRTPGLRGDWLPPGPRWLCLQTARPQGHVVPVRTMSE